MIEKVTSIPHISDKKMSLAKIYCQYEAFLGTPIANDFYLQKCDGKIAAVISTDGGSMNIYCDGADFLELCEFIRALCPSVIFTEYEHAEPLGLCLHRVRNMLYTKTEKSATFYNANFKNRQKP